MLEVGDEGSRRLSRNGSKRDWMGSRLALEKGLLTVNAQIRSRCTLHMPMWLLVLQNSEEPIAVDREELPKEGLGAGSE